jgi:hypothetical protein
MVDHKTTESPRTQRSLSAATKENRKDGGRREKHFGRGFTRMNTDGMARGSACLDSFSSFLCRTGTRNTLGV